MGCFVSGSGVGDDSSVLVLFGVQSHEKASLAKGC